MKRISIFYTLGVLLGACIGLLCGSIMVDTLENRAYKNGYVKGVEASQDLYYDKSCGEICAEPIPEHLK
jgi:hypothetical protein